MKCISWEIISKIEYLRKHGWSLKEIRRETGVGVGTVVKYTSGIGVLPEFQIRLREKRMTSINRKKLAEQKAAEEAEKVIQDLSLKEKIIFVSALYWAEGNKKDFNLINSDPEIVKIFVSALREMLKVPQDDLRLSIRIYEDLDRKKCLNYWSEITGVPVEKFVNVDVLKGRKSGKLSFGMCRVRVRKGGYLLKYILALKRKAVECFCPHSSTDRVAAS